MMDGLDGLDVLDKGRAMRREHSVRGVGERIGHVVNGGAMACVILLLGAPLQPAAAGAGDRPSTPQAPTAYLWEGAAPGAHGTAPQDRPKLWVYGVGGGAPRSAMVIFPGGGYGALALDHEGVQMARFFNRLGMQAFIVDYRHRGKGYGYPAPLDDARRALRLVRHRAGEWHVDPHRVGIIGFSAGGHLASALSTHFDDGKAEASDRVERQSCRPDFAVLCYPVIGLGKPYTHRGSQRNLLGDHPDPRLVKELSSEDRVTARTPPTFLWHTMTDRVVPVQNSLKYFEAMVRHGVPGELHVFPAGRHGLGLARQKPGAAAWPQLLETWLKGRAILPAVAAPSASGDSTK